MRRESLARACTFAIAIAAASCSTSRQPPAHPLAPDEIALRRALGVPDEAERVVVFGQNSHLDVDWQKTFPDYYASFVGDVFTEARKILDAQPRAFYSIAEMAFLEHHVQARPEELAPLKAAVARGQLRIVGGAVTSPDTLLPETELLFRDFLYGARFAEDTLGARMHAAWLPDSFGHAATVPDVLAAAGYDSVAFSRIDGSPTVWREILDRDGFPPPLPGSTAETLQRLGSADFKWHGAGGAVVLGHFMPGFGLYCEGDNLDFDEHLEVPGGHVGTFHGDDPSFTDDRIDAYVAELAAYAKTPYLFVPVGCDFQHPKDRLVEYLDGYDQRRYGDSRTWAVDASFEDYARLVSFWSDALPDVSGDLSPTFMGFYGSRADLKRGVRDAARPLFVAESFAAAIGDEGRAIVEAAAPQVELLARSDHHDFVTGTSADDVVKNEQMPLVAQVRAAGEAEVAQVAAAIAKRIPIVAGETSRLLAFNASSAARDDVASVAFPISGGVVPPMHANVPMEVVGTPGPKDTTATLRFALAGVPPWSWTTMDLLPGAAAAPQARVSLAMLDAAGAPATGGAIARVVLANASVRAQWDRGVSGFALTSLAIDGEEAIAAPSMTVGDYLDEGSLWRLGHEVPGCAFTLQPPPAGAASVTVVENTPLVVRVAFASPTETREASLAAGAHALDVAITTGAAQGTTRTVSFALAVPTDAPLRTSSPAGWQERPVERIFDPTFWPAVTWAMAGRWAVLLRQSTGVRTSGPGRIELMAARDARAQKCELEGGTGTDTGTHRIEWRIARAASVADAERAAQAFDRPIDLEVVGTAQSATTDLAPRQSLASVDGDAILSAIKPAERGGGVVVRVLLLPGPASVRLAPVFAGKQLGLVDVAERDLRALGIAGDAIAVDGHTFGSIASFRLQ